MKDSFTLDDLILYSSSIGSESEEEMEKNQAQTWDEHPVGPDQRIVSNILSYSRALSVLKTKRAGCVKLLLN